MIPEERRKLILEQVETNNAVSVADLCARLDVSEMTIRRDLRILSNQGLLLRVHGGAVSRRGRSYEPPYLVRVTSNVELKEAIGREAARLVQEGESLAIDVGTTTLEVAKHLVGVPNLTVVTSSLNIANVLADSPNIRLIVSGGVVRPQERSLVGHLATRTFEEFQVDKVFIGIGGIHPEAGLSEFNLEDALVKQAMIQHAEQVIVVADSTKLMRTCFALVAPLSVVDVIVTDWMASEEAVGVLRDRGIEVIIAQRIRTNESSGRN